MNSTLDIRDEYLQGGTKSIAAPSFSCTVGTMYQYFRFSENICQYRDFRPETCLRNRNFYYVFSHTISLYSVALEIEISRNFLRF